VWQPGQDAPWAKRWEVASTLLGVLGFTVFSLALVARAEGAVFTGVAVAVVLLWVLAAGCVVAEKAVRRQAAQEARAARHERGLPVETRMWAPRTVWIVWVVAGCLLAACGLAVWVTQTRLDPASARPEELLSQAQQLSATAAIVMSTALVVSAVCGAVHALARRRRQEADRARVRDAEQELTAPADGG
jgi:ABC-type Fe3+ transport system permease subunit